MFNSRLIKNLYCLQRQSKCFERLESKYGETESEVIDINNKRIDYYYFVQLIKLLYKTASYKTKLICFSVRFILIYRCPLKAMN